MTFSLLAMLIAKYTLLKQKNCFGKGRRNLINAIETMRSSLMENYCSGLMPRYFKNVA